MAKRPSVRHATAAARTFEQAVSRLALAARTALVVACAAATGTFEQIDAHAQEAYRPLVPKGSLRIGIVTSYSSFSARYRPGPGGQPGDGRPVALGAEFSGPAGTSLFPSLAGYEAAVARAASGNHRLRLGTVAAVAEKNAVRLAMSASVGVLDWLSVGVTVPLVRNETEFSMHFAADSGLANAGLATGNASAVSGFLSSFGGAIGAYRTFRASTCAADPGGLACREATTQLSGAEELHDALSAMYESPVAPLERSPAGLAMQARLATLAEAFQAAGVQGVPSAVPLARSPMDVEDLQRLVTDPRFGIAGTHPLAQWTSLWALGDIEVRADAKLWETGGAGSAADGRAEVGAGVIARLPTGVRDDPANFLDAGSGDGQTDIEARAWANGRWRARLGAWAEVAYGLQLAGVAERRVFDPYYPIAPAAVQRQLSWNPGNYQIATVSPWFRLADDLTVLAGYRYFRKARDSFSLADARELDEGEPPGDGAAMDLSVLASGSEAMSSRIHLGGVFRRSPTPSGSPLWPAEVRVVYRRVVGGSGIMPKTSVFEVRLRFLARLW